MNLKVLKLRSGEEIACEVIEETTEKVVVSNPMVFKTISSLDLTGRSIEITTLQEWLSNNNDTNITLPMNHIVFISEANKDTVKMYTLEKEKTSATDKNDKVTDSDLFGLFLNSLMNGSGPSDMDGPPEPKPRRRKAKRSQPKKDYLPPDMEDESELDRHMIMMQMYIPAEAIMNLITSGILKPETLQEMIDEVKKRNRFTGDEKKRKDFGSKLSDWNPDPNSDDYK